MYNPSHQVCRATMFLLQPSSVLHIVVLLLPWQKNFVSPQSFASIQQMESSLHRKYINCNLLKYYFVILLSQSLNFHLLDIFVWRVQLISLIFFSSEIAFVLLRPSGIPFLSESGSSLVTSGSWFLWDLLPFFSETISVQIKHTQLPICITEL